MQKQISNIIDALEELKQDKGLPKNIINKIEGIICALKSDEDLSLSINKASHELDEIANDSNLQSYLRTEIWNIISMLELVK